MKLIHMADLFFSSTIFQHKITIFQVYALFQFMQSAEKQNICRTVFPICPQQFIVIVQHAGICLRLILCDPFLGRNIIIHSMMTIQMIRRNIEDRTDFRMKLYNTLQHKAADLCCRHSIRLHTVRHICIWHADISHHIGMWIIIFQDLPHKGCRRGLSIRSGDCCNTPLSAAISKFDLTPDWNLTPSDLQHHWNIHRDSRTWDHQIHRVQQAFRQSSDHDLCLTVCF